MFVRLYDYTMCILCLDIVERNTEVSSFRFSQSHNREEALPDLQGVVYKLAAPLPWLVADFGV